MRTNRFRPAVAQLDRRLSPSDAVPGVTSAVTSAFVIDEGSAVLSQNAGLMEFLGPPIILYSSGQESGYNPLCPPINPGMPH